MTDQLLLRIARIRADYASELHFAPSSSRPVLNSFDVGDIRTTHLALGERGRGDRRRRAESEDVGLLPLGLDSHRYRCCGNGVVSNVSEWIGVRLAEAMA